MPLQIFFVIIGVVEGILVFDIDTHDSLGYGRGNKYKEIHKIKMIPR